jgi:mycoredoxin
MSARFTMYSTSWCGYCHRLSSQLHRDGLRVGVDFQVVDIEHQPEAADIVASANNGNRTVPTLVFADGTSMTNPSLAQVKSKIGV